MKRFFALVLCAVMALTGCGKSYDEMVGEARGIAYLVIGETDKFMDAKADGEFFLEALCKNMRHYEAEMQKLACGTIHQWYSMVLFISNDFNLLSQSKTQEEKDKRLEEIRKSRNELAEMVGYPEK